MIQNFERGFGVLRLTDQQIFQRPVLIKIKTDKYLFPFHFSMQGSGDFTRAICRMASMRSLTSFTWLQGCPNRWYKGKCSLLSKKSSYLSRRIFHNFSDVYPEA